MNASRTSCFSIELARIRISNALTSAQHCFKLRSADAEHRRAAQGLDEMVDPAVAGGAARPLAVDVHRLVVGFDPGQDIIEIISLRRAPQRVGAGWPDPERQVAPQHFEMGARPVGAGIPAAAPRNRNRIISRPNSGCRGRPFATVPTRYSLKPENASTIHDSMVRFPLNEDTSHKVEVATVVANLLK